MIPIERQLSVLKKTQCRKLKPIMASMESLKGDTPLVPLRMVFEAESFS